MRQGWALTRWPATHNPDLSRGSQPAPNAQRLTRNGAACNCKRLPVLLSGVGGCRARAAHPERNAGTCPQRRPALLCREMPRTLK
eukprot:9511909-Alexandrium_andersonii.AAC.1